jgi:hypothetical protein
MKNRVDQSIVIVILILKSRVKSIRQKNKWVRLVRVELPINDGSFC